MNQKHVKRLLEIANNELPRVEESYKTLLSEVERLTYEKQYAEESIQKLNNEIIYHGKMVENNKFEYEELESKKRIFYLKKIRLESVIEQLQKSHEYGMIVQIVKRQVKNVFGDDKQLIKFAFESIIESLLRDPFRSQSLIEYAMSSTSKSSSLNGIKNMEHDTKPSIYVQGYLSSDYEADRKQLQYIKDIILEESERFLQQKD